MSSWTHAEALDMSWLGSGSPKDWTSTYSDLGGWTEGQFSGAAVTGIYVPGECESSRRKKYVHKVAMTKKTAMNKNGRERRAELELAAPPPQKAPLHNNQPPFAPVLAAAVDKHLARVSNSSRLSAMMKPDVDPRQVLRLADQLSVLARDRHTQGFAAEALVALTQAKGMVQSCLANMNAPGLEENNQTAHQMLMCISSEIVELSKSLTGKISLENSLPSPGFSSTRSTKSSRKELQSTSRIGAISAPPALDGGMTSTVFPSPLKKNLYWPAAASIGDTSPSKWLSNSRTVSVIDHDYLCGQIATSPIAGSPDSNRYMTESKRASLIAFNDQLRKHNQKLKAFLIAPSLSSPMSSKRQQPQMTGPSIQHRFLPDKFFKRDERVPIRLSDAIGCFPKPATIPQKFAATINFVCSARQFADKTRNLGLMSPNGR